ncbi:hypothetical protein J2Y58_001006 [Sphingomonas sp. BE138]|nr:hypothetical protein [Sphingomonas sp. BE138]
MAAQNRRQLLTGDAACAAGAAIVAGGAALASEASGAALDRSGWVAAMRQWEAAEAEAQADDERYQRLRDSWIATGDNSAECRQRFGIDAAATQSNRTDDAAADALSRLLDIPAPDADALAWKIHHLFKPDHGDFAGAFAFSHIKQTLADAVRLAGGTPSGMLA